LLRYISSKVRRCNIVVCSRDNGVAKLHWTRTVSAVAIKLHDIGELSINFCTPPQSDEVVWIVRGVIRAGTALRLLPETAETGVTEAEPGRALVPVHCRGGPTYFPFGKTNVLADADAATFIVDSLVHTLGDNSLVRAVGDNSLVRTVGDNPLARTVGVTVACGSAVPLIICTGLAVRADLRFS